MSACIKRELPFFLNVIITYFVFYSGEHSLGVGRSLVKRGRGINFRYAHAVCRSIHTLSSSAREHGKDGACLVKLKLRRHHGWCGGAPLFVQIDCRGARLQTRAEAETRIPKYESGELGRPHLMHVQSLAFGVRFTSNYCSAYIVIWMSE